MVKNTAGQKIGAQLVSATDGSAFTGSVTVSVTGDAGTQATGSVGSGACTHEGNGYHTYAPAQAETNYTLVAFTFTGTGAVPVTVQVFTTGYDPTAANLPANVTQFGGTNATSSGGRPEVNTSHAAGTAWGSGAITAAAIAADAITAAKIADGAIDAATFAAGAINAAAIAADAITDAKVASDVTIASVTGAVGSVTATVSADVVSISGDATAANNLESYLDGTAFMPVDAHAPTFSVSGTTLTVKQPDGTTTAYTKTVTTDAGAEPITGAS